MARVVLPRPGGPESSTWSATPPRCRAASRTSPSWSETRAWPSNSASVVGRSADSAACSSGSVSVRTRLDWFTGGPGSAAPLASAPAHRPTGPRTPGAPPPRRRPRRPGPTSPGPAGPGSPGRARPRPASPVGARSAPSPTALILSLSSITIRCAPLRPMPGTLHSTTRFSVAIAWRSSSGLSTASAAWASFGPTPGGGEQQLEELPLVGGGEPVEGERVLADDQRRWPASSAARPADRRPCWGCTARAPRGRRPRPPPRSGPPPAPAR